MPVEAQCRRGASTGSCTVKGDAMDINCLEMGTDCDQVVSGESTEEFVSAVHGHMKLAHGYNDEQLASAELDEVIKGAIWQSARPAEIRTPRPQI